MVHIDLTNRYINVTDVDTVNDRITITWLLPDAYKDLTNLDVSDDINNPTALYIIYSLDDTADNYYSDISGHTITIHSWSVEEVGIGGVLKVLTLTVESSGDIYNGSYPADAEDYVLECNIVNMQFSYNETTTITTTTEVPVTSTNTKASQGDVFIGYMDHTALYYNDTSEGTFANYYFPVESSINVNLRHDDAFSKWYNNDTSYKGTFSEEGNEDTGQSELYLYNTVYSQENDSKLYFPRPFDELPKDEDVFTTRIRVSEKKFNGETSDSWLSFLTNNFIDVDGNYGPVNNIMDYNNNLLYWQDDAFGIVGVDPRSLITDNNPGALVLGTGAVLSRFDYLSTMVGNTDKFGLIKTPKGIYWYDNNNETIIRYNGKSIERLSKLLGVQSWLNENRFSTSIVGYNTAHDEVLFTLTDSDSNTSTIVFNELVNAFTGFYDMEPTMYIQHKELSLNSNDNINLYLFNASDSPYGVYYNTTPEESTIKIVMNADVDRVKVFDAINFTSYVNDSANNDKLIYDTTFGEVRFYNSFQNTDWITLTPGTNIERKKGMWSMFIPRNVLNVDPSTNPDIFDASNFDPNQPFKPRMRDTYLITDFKFDNSENYKIKFPFLHTKYRDNYR